MDARRAPYKPALARRLDDSKVVPVRGRSLICVCSARDPLSCGPPRGQGVEHQLRRVVVSAMFRLLHFNIELGCCTLLGSRPRFRIERTEPTSSGWRSWTSPVSRRQGIMEGCARSLPPGRREFVQVVVYPTRIPDAVAAPRPLDLTGDSLSLGILDSTSGLQSYFQVAPRTWYSLRAACFL